MPDHSPPANREARKYERVSLSLTGHLFNPEDGTEIACELINLSGGGAALNSAGEIPPGKHMVLYIEGFGRYEGTTVFHSSGMPALNFTIGEWKRKRLTEMLHQFISHGFSGVTEVRRDGRAPSSSGDEIVLENGERWPCDILDISLHGASLKTEGRPSPGEVVALGRSLGLVVRHHRHGIAIQYVRAVPAGH